MINLLTVVFVLIFLVGMLLLIFINRRGRGLGVLKGNRIYSDTEIKPGEVLSSRTLRLVGKPDFIIEENGMFFPVEIKSGKTPASPYQNHTMQLMAYCLLVEENLGVRPIGGYLKYPNREFKIAYTDEAKDSIRQVVDEILQKKLTGEELHCEHSAHN